MRTIRRTAAFKRDYKREQRGRFANNLDAELASGLTELAADRNLAPRYHDHQLSGQRKNHRDCHVRPDLVPIYRKPDADRLDLARLGSHSDLGF